MPPRPQPKVHQLLLKTHKVTIALSGVLPTTTISQLKREVLEALKSEVSEDIMLEISLSMPNPLTLESQGDIEICRQDKERGKPTGTYTVLDPGRQVREHDLPAWETLFIQFRNPETRALLPITVTLPSIDDDVPESTPAPSEPPSSHRNAKGKRKADFSDDELSLIEPQALGSVTNPLPS